MMVAQRLSLTGSLGCVDTGSYSDSCGLPLVRDDVAHYIAERDGFPCSADDVFLCTGASNGIKVGWVLSELC